jgi:hypothetical protein
MVSESTQAELARNKSIVQPGLEVDQASPQLSRHRCGSEGQWTLCLHWDGQSLIPEHQT